MADETNSQQQAEQQRRPRPALSAPMDGDPGLMGELLSPVSRGNLAPGADRAAIGIAGLGLILAMPVTRPRDHNMVMQNLRVLCAANGGRYVYSWEVRNRREGTRDTIEGPTVKLANDLARVYGNSFAGVVEVTDVGDHWQFLALFVDRETGFMYARPFQQRKGQDSGMKDADRQRDIIYQIGASKAIRNVVVNALASYTDFCLEESKRNLLGWIGKNREKAEEYVARMCEKFSIDLKRVEAYIGRLASQWTDRDLATVTTRLRSIEEGMASAGDVFPSAEDAADIMKEKTEEKTDRRRKKETKEPPKEVGGEGPKEPPPPTPPPAEKKKAAPAPSVREAPPKSPDDDIADGLPFDESE